MLHTRILLLRAQKCRPPEGVREANRQLRYDAVEVTHAAAAEGLRLATLERQAYAALLLALQLWYKSSLGHKDSTRNLYHVTMDRRGQGIGDRGKRRED